jgi:hypothetical protein
VAGGSLLFQGIEDLLGHRAGAFGSMLGGAGGGFMPPETVDVTNNYYGADPASAAENAFMPPAGDPNAFAPAFQPPDPASIAGPDPGLGVDWGSNIDPGPGIDPCSFDPTGGSDGGSMAV